MIVCVVVVAIIVVVAVIVRIVINSIEKFIEQCIIIFHTDNRIQTDDDDFNRLYKTE